ncbi:824_t:CDS:2, partial [Entrophospora sp. SA101]
EDFHQIPDKYDDLQIESTTITKASKLNQTITPTTASKPKAVKIRPILNYHGKPTLEQMQAYQDQPIPFKSKMECESYHEQNGISSKELWNWSPIRVFIGIWTTAKGHKIRSIVRAINLKQQENLIGDNVDFKFILGRPPKDVYTPDLKLKLTTENDTYGDLVMLDMEENMNNGKAYYYWKWVWEHLGTMKYDYAAKADDDVFVHFQNLALNLRPLPRDNVYYGCKHKYYITGMLVVLSMNYPHLISTTPFNKTEWRGGEDTRLGKWLINHANSTLNPIDEHCLLFQDPRIPVFYVVGRKWASPQSIVIHWLKDLYAWKGVIDLYIPDVIKDLKALPFTLLFSQLVMAVILLHISSLFGVVQLPKIQKDICIGVLPLIGINVLGLSFNTVCLQYVDASFYQVARALVLPFTVLFTFIVLKKKSSYMILLSCFIVCIGFFVGVSSEKQISVSLLGVFYGVFSSITTALHAIVIKKSLAVVKDNTMDLVYYNNLLSSVCFIPLILFTGEEFQIYQMFSDSSESFHTFLIGIVVTGFFGFLINIAGFLQIKVTSPISHMISSAFRGVIQTVLGVTIFSDILTIGRIGSIGIILFGSCLYTWIKDYESKQVDKNQAQEEIAMNEKDLESGQRLLKTRNVDFVIEDDDDDEDDNVVVKNKDYHLLTTNDNKD